MARLTYSEEPRDIWVVAETKDGAIRDGGVDVRTHGMLPAAARGWREKKTVNKTL